MLQIRKNLKEIRKQKGFTQSEMAEKLGIPRSSYAAFETLVTPNEPTLKNISEILGVNYMDFYKGDIHAEDRLQMNEPEVPYKLPNDELMAIRATLKINSQTIAKIQAKVFGRTVEDCLDEMEQNTILLLRELKKASS